MTVRRKNIFFLLLALSGFSGLIYESIWSHYIKLFLGHSAYAQTLVMAIFMGGMAVGSWICSKYSLRWKNLFLYYAVVEAIIGIFALIFHTVFDSVIHFSYYSIIPHFKTATAATVFQWSLSACLILPQSILIGMPFPLMTAAVLRQFPENAGGTISRLYFLNSMGAVVGVLVSGFMLIRTVGLPGTIRIAGVVNIAIAIGVWFLLSEERERSFSFQPPSSERNRILKIETPSESWLIYLFAAFITGASSFMYEMGWIRMLSLVLGTTTHAFELMLSAFILGLALGAAWIKRRIDRIHSHITYLVVVQMVMGLMAIATLPVYDKSFDLMQWVLRSVNRTGGGYVLFNVSSHAIALAVMLPATFCAGMTLPLITYMLLKKGHGEASAGAVYAANTFGAIFGMVFSVHLGMPVFGLNGLISLGACLDIALGLFLLWRLSSRAEAIRLRYAAAALCGCSAALITLWFNGDPYKMNSGVYLNGTLFTPENTEFVYHRDGKTATVSVAVHDNGLVSLRTNGKSDSAINMNRYGQHSSDEDTMILSAAIPMALHPQARLAANIGLGTGLTTHALLTNRRLYHVDTVEIEEAMLDASKKFGERTGLAHSDPRSEIHIDDAKSFFSAHNERYDIIISEPSHPWVSGIANLFTGEFYSVMNRHLAKNGLFVQWVQMTDMDMDLLASVLKAIAANFSDYALYAANDVTLLIIAARDGNIAPPDPGLLAMPDTAKILNSIYISGIHDIEVRKIGDKQLIDRLISAFPVDANSDYYPVLDQNAVRARFLNAKATDILKISHDALPVVDLLSEKPHVRRSTEVTPSPYFSKSKSVFTAMALRDFFLHGYFLPKYGKIPAEVGQQAVFLKEFLHEGKHRQDQDARMLCLYNTAINILPYLSPAEVDAIWDKLESGKYARLLTGSEKNWFTLFRAIGSRDTARMATAARSILETDKELHQAARQYLVAAGMLGYVSQGAGDESDRLWAEYSRPLPAAPDSSSQKLLFNILMAGNSEGKARF